MKTILTLSALLLLVFLPAKGDAQYVTVSGYVSDLLTGALLKNVNVFEKSSGIGTITNEEGYYKLILKPGQMNITFSDNGFESYTERFYISSDTTMRVQLKPEVVTRKSEKSNVNYHTGVQEEKMSDRK